MEPIARYDELYVISDLHLGGVTGFQIFDQGDLLGRVIDQFTARPANAELALVINGDLVDFLAEQNAAYLDAAGAVAKLQRIVHDDAFAPIFRALQRFVKKANRSLIITLGNHDLELALPWVREALLQELSLGDASARGRITLAFDGSGFLCVVGTAKVYCVHGNDVDTWNITDYEKLRRLGRDGLQGRATDAWTPNAGTKLVIDVMNNIKRRFPFVDLLKPEIEAVLPVLYALDPAQKPKLATIADIGARLTWDKARRLTGFLAAEELGADGQDADTAPASSAALEQVLRNTFAPGQSVADGGSTVESLLRTAHETLAAGKTPLDQVAAAEAGEQLGLWGAFWSWITGKDRDDILFEALEGLKKDVSFQLKNADKTFNRLDEIVAEDVDFVIAGHTHLERALRRGAGRGYYYNSGTWVRLIQLEGDVLNSKKNFARVLKAFEQGTMAALDDVAGLVQRKPAVVSIRAEGGAVHAALNRARARAGVVVLDPIEQSEFTV